MADKLMYIPNDGTQNYPLCRLKLVVETFEYYLIFGGWDNLRCIIPGGSSTPLMFYQRERGHWAVYYSSSQSFMITFSYSLAYQPWVLELNVIQIVYFVECQNISTTNCNLQKGYFVHHWECTMYINLSAIGLSLQIPEGLHAQNQWRANCLRSYLKEIQMPNR